MSLRVAGMFANVAQTFFCVAGGSAASDGRLDVDALAGQLLEEPVQGGAAGRAAERLEDRLAAEGFRQAGSAVPASRIGSQAPAAGNVRIRFVS